MAPQSFFQMCEVVNCWVMTACECKDWRIMPVAILFREHIGKNTVVSISRKVQVNGEWKIYLDKWHRLLDSAQRVSQWDQDPLSWGYNQCRHSKHATGQLVEAWHESRDVWWHCQMASAVSPPSWSPAIYLNLALSLEISLCVIRESLAHRESHQEGTARHRSI